MAILINDNHEPLVDLRKYLPNVVIRIDKQRIRREKTVYLRNTVAQMLAKADSYLPKGLRFVIGDAWRPAFVQCSIYFDFVSKGKKRYPGLSYANILKEIKKYVAPWKGLGVSGHMTGGAIDLRLADRSGRKIPMRSKSLDYRENALSNQPKLSASLRRNRQILFDAMEKAGFTNYPLEYWHWNYGDYQWAKRGKKSNAFYGAVSDVNNIYVAEKCPCMSGKRFNKCHGA